MESFRIFYPPHLLPTIHAHLDSDSCAFTFQRNTHLALYTTIFFALALRCVAIRGRDRVWCPEVGGSASAGPVFGLNSLVRIELRMETLRDLLDEC